MGGGRGVEGWGVGGGAYHISKHIALTMKDNINYCKKIFFQATLQ